MWPSAEAPAPGRVRGLARLGQLLRVARQYQVPGRAAYGQGVGQRHLPRLVHEQGVHAAGQAGAGPQPRGACGHVELAVAQRPLQLLVRHPRGRTMQDRVVPVRPLADPRRQATSVRVLAHGADQFLDDRVRRAGDPDRAAVSDEVEDLPGGGAGLPRSRRSLQRQVRTPGQRSQPDRGPGRRLARSRQRSPGPGRPPQQQGGGQRPAVRQAGGQLDRPGRIVDRPDRPASPGRRVNGRVAGGEPVLLRREREPPHPRLLHPARDLAAGQPAERVRLADQLRRAQRAQVEVPPPGRLGLPPVPAAQAGQQRPRPLLVGPRGRFRGGRGPPARTGSGRPPDPHASAARPLRQPGAAAGRRSVRPPQAAGPPASPATPAWPGSHPRCTCPVSGAYAYQPVLTPGPVR